MAMLERLPDGRHRVLDNAYEPRWTRPASVEGGTVTIPVSLWDRFAGSKMAGDRATGTYTLCLMPSSSSDQVAHLQVTPHTASPALLHSCAPPCHHTLPLGWGSGRHRAHQKIGIRTEKEKGRRARGW